MRNTMQIGRLNDLIEIVRRDLVINEDGFEVETYNTIYKLRGKVSTQSSKSKLEESVVNGRESSKSLLKVMIRKRDIDETDYVKYKGVNYRVTGIGKKAFSGCRSLKTVMIQKKAIKKMAKMI